MSTGLFSSGDELRRLQSVSWNVGDVNGAIDFPFTTIGTSLAHRIVEHKYINVDGAQLESTGREPIVISGKALFYNHIVPGPSETWEYGTLFPFQFLKFINSVHVSSIGQLTHPWYNTLSARVKSVQTDISAERRDGVAVDIVFVEHTFAELEKPQPYLNLNPPAENLDTFLNETAVLADIQKRFKKENFTSFASAMAQITGAINSAELFSRQISGKIDGTLYRLNQVIEAVDNLETTIINMQNIQRIKSTCETLWYNLQQINIALRLSQQGRKKQIDLGGKSATPTSSYNLNLPKVNIPILSTISTYIVPNNSTTFSSLAPKLGTTVDELLRLNPTLPITATLKEFDVIHYKSSK
jgi:prophage DNA circulation protein